MSWIAGLRSDVLYTVQKRPLDPRWSQQDLQILLGWCATGQAMGWSENRAFQAAEAMVFQKKNHGITWSQESLLEDIQLLAIFGKEHESQ